MLNCLEKPQHWVKVTFVEIPPWVPYRNAPHSWKTSSDLGTTDYTEVKYIEEVIKVIKYIKFVLNLSSHLRVLANTANLIYQNTHQCFPDISWRKLEGNCTCLWFEFVEPKRELYQRTHSAGAHRVLHLGAPLLYWLCTLTTLSPKSFMRKSPALTLRCAGRRIPLEDSKCLFQHCDWRHGNMATCIQWQKSFMLSSMTWLKWFLCTLCFIFQLPHMTSSSISADLPTLSLHPQKKRMSTCSIACKVIHVQFRSRFLAWFVHFSLQMCTGHSVLPQESAWLN